MENNENSNIVEATVHWKNKNNQSPDKVIVLTTFIDNGHLYSINNMGNKQIMLGQDKSSEFENLISVLKLVNNAEGFDRVRLDTSNYKEDETPESIRLKKTIDNSPRSKLKNKP